MPELDIRSQRVTQADLLFGRRRLAREFRTEDAAALRADLQRLVDALNQLQTPTPRLFPTPLIVSNTVLQFGQLALCASGLSATLTLQRATADDVGRLYGIRVLGSSTIVVKDANGTTLETITTAGVHLRAWGGS